MSETQNQNPTPSVPNQPETGAKPPETGFKLPISGNGNGNGEDKKNAAVSFLAKLMGGKTSAEMPGKTPSGVPLPSLSPETPSPGTSAKPLFNLPSFATGGSLAAKPFTRAKIEEFAEQKKLKMAKTAFWAITLITVFTFVYFVIQLNPDFSLFGDTMAKNYKESRQKVIAKQTEISEDRLQVAQLNIDRINLLADSFLLNLSQSESKVLSPAERQKAKDKVVASRQLIIESFTEAKNALKKPFGFDLPELSAFENEPKDPFEESLLGSLKQKEQKARQKQNPDAVEARLLSNMALLYQNKTFRNYLQSLNLNELDDAKLSEAISKIRDLGKDDVALMAKVKQNRIRWTEVIDRINMLTKEIDPLFGKDNLFDEIGGIRYSSYSFDQAKRELSIQGEVKTPASDSKTFSLIAKLIEKFESSPYFKNVEMRDFSKSFNEEEGFMSSIQFDMQLE